MTRALGFNAGEARLIFDALDLEGAREPGTWVIGDGDFREKNRDMLGYSMTIVVFYWFNISKSHPTKKWRFPKIGVPLNHPF